MSDTLNDRLRRAAEMARQRQQGAGFPSPETDSSQYEAEQPRTFREVEVPSAAEETEYRYNPAPNVPEVDEFSPALPGDPKPKKKKTTAILVGLGILLLLAVGAIVLLTAKHSNEVEQLRHEQEQLELANQQLQLANEYDNLNNEFAQYENQTSLLANDSIVQKYSAARAQVEKLLQELKNEKNKSAAQISKLKGEIETLKGILRTYVEQINELKQENQQLTAENQEVKAQNQQLAQTVEHVQASNRQLNERMTLAEKLNVTGVSLTALKKNGKVEKNVTKARQLKVSFTVPQNNSTPVGQKVFYLRIINPEGELLGNSGSFKFEGSTVGCTALKGIEYAGEEVHDQFYWNVTSTLTPGTYTVELFTDGYRLCSRSFTLKK